MRTGKFKGKCQLEQWRTEGGVVGLEPPLTTPTIFL